MFGLSPYFVERINTNGEAPPSHPEMGPCWLWTGSTSSGFPVARIGSRSDKSRRTVFVHKHIYEQAIAPVADGLVVARLCEVLLCCRPDHMQAVSRAKRNALVARVEHINRTERYRRYRDKHPEKLRESQRAYVAKNPEKRQLYKDRATAKRYGLSLAAYQRLFVEHGEVCAICAQPEKAGRRLAVDHDAKTGRVRGLLCSRHNLGIGHFNHDVALLSAAVNYINASVPDDDA